MADISIERMKALQWIADVETELSRVEIVLKNVSTACTTVPGEKDVIMEGIVNTGEVLHEFWGRMCDGFKKATSNVKKAIEKIGETADAVIEDIDNVKSKVGR